MIPRNLVILAAVTISVITLAILYLGFDHGAVTPADTAEAAMNSGRTSANPIVSKDETVSAPKPKSAPPADFDASKYTTAPKAGSVASTIVQIFMDRKLPDTEKVRRLLNMVPHLDEEGKFMAMDRATQLIEDNDYMRLRPQLLRLAESDRLRELVMLDMLTRDDGIKMPSLVELLRNPSETTRNEAREILEAFLDEDYGNDPQAWSAPVQRWLAENQEF